MDSLVTRLEQEVGLTHEQAVNAVKCIRKYLNENGLDPDWEEFLEAQAHKLSISAKTALDELTGKTQTWGAKLDDWADKAHGKLEDLGDKAKQTIKDVRNKAADFIADKD